MTSTDIFGGNQGRFKKMVISNGTQDIFDFERLLWKDGQLSYIGQDCFRIPAIVGLTYGNQVKRLDLSFNSIRTLDGLEMFPCVEELILDNNELGDDAEFIYNAHLTTLSLNKNKFWNLEKLLSSLATCYPNLTYLSLLGTPACPDQLSSSDNDDDDYRRYRYFTLYHLPKLKFLDSSPVRPGERNEARRVGAFMKVNRPKADEIETGEDAVDALYFHPLPHEQPAEGTHRGMFGVLRYRYSGKHSEGNRFIRNHEL